MVVDNLTFVTMSMLSCALAIQLMLYCRCNSQLTCIAHASNGELHEYKWVLKLVVERIWH
uniref:Uncharacterized protein n=1 Tax=Arundo donax TaxID=35708 RepID=A0A0A8ZB53_ARUDO